MPRKTLIIAYTYQPPPIESREQWEVDDDRYCQHCGERGSVATFNFGETVLCLACNKISGIAPPHDIPSRLALLKAEHSKEKR